ncbi:MAG TPA: carbamoyltransferase [Acidobacteriota bacterium]|nr:carbamoyltransferase [Acidobacteriota bacterium]
MLILGISAFYHDSAACLLRDGRIVAAVQEERLTRVKHDSSFPVRAIQSCLEIAECRIEDVDFVVFYEKPFLKFERLLETYVRRAPRGFASYRKVLPLWVKDKLWMKHWIQQRLNYGGPILFSEHHESHAAAAFFPSPFASAAIVTVDGAGEWTTAAWGKGEGNDLKLDYEIRFPHSLGLLYTAFTYYLGFKVNSDEYKVMGLAPYGQPVYQAQIEEELIRLHDDGSFRLNLDYFNYETGFTMTSELFEKRFGGPPRKPGEPLTQRHKDLAASIQAVTEKAMLRLCRRVREETGEERLCMAGGVALNCVANGRILRESGFREIWIQPAAGDAGGAVGAALALYHRFLGKPREVDGSCDGMGWGYLGPRFDGESVRRVLDNAGAQYEELPEPELIRRTCLKLAEGAVVGWFQGRMEFGPRALGNRSILADPRHSGMQAKLNLRIKFRESFRPFAPSVLEERQAEFFESDYPSPYMLLVSPVAADKRECLPAVTHVDGSARVQTVNEQQNGRYYRLIRGFADLTGCPVLVNTSFNVRNEPIVCSPQDAYNCFMRTNMDVLVMEQFFLTKEGQEWERP